MSDENIEHEPCQYCGDEHDGETVPILIAVNSHGTVTVAVGPIPIDEIFQVMEALIHDDDFRDRVRRESQESVMRGKAGLN